MLVMGGKIVAAIVISVAATVAAAGPDLALLGRSPWTSFATSSSADSRW
jgi:hypothetical protein